LGFAQDGAMQTSLFNIMELSFAHRPFHSQQVKVARTPAGAQIAEGDSLTALAAFIVYLLLPEFWVGWKQA
jgi:hypothetical protein